MAQNDKKFFLSHSVSWEPYLIDCAFWYTWFLENDDISKDFVHFFKILIFWVFRGGEGGGRAVKGQKIAHNYQFHSVTLCMLRTVHRIIKIFVTQVICSIWIFIKVRTLSYLNVAITACPGENWKYQYRRRFHKWMPFW